MTARNPIPVRQDGAETPPALGVENCSAGSRPRAPRLPTSTGGSRGNLNRHGSRFRDVLPVLERPGFIERFNAKVDRRGDDECWPWIAARNQHGYGVIGVSKRPVNYIASRVAYAIATGEEPGALSVCHTCDNPPCCNPAHLWLGTNADNARDRNAKGRGTALRGEAAPGSKLTEQQVRDIFLSNDFLPVLTSRYGVSETCITGIRNRKRWGWLTEGLTRPEKQRATIARERLKTARAMASAGKTHREIAAVIGVAHDYVSVLLCRGNKGRSK